MKSSLHEDLTREEELHVGSDRGFGLTVGGLLVAIALVRAWAHGGFGWVEPILAVAGLALVGVGLLAPSTLVPLNRAWMKLGLLLARVVSPIVLGLIYYALFAPIGLWRRLRGRDSLRLAFDPAADSYWVPHAPTDPPSETMKNQF
jgi:hypothetical protein